MYSPIQFIEILKTINLPDAYSQCAALFGEKGACPQLGNAPVPTEEKAEKKAGLFGKKR